MHIEGGQTYRVRYVADGTATELYAYMKHRANVGRCPIYLDGNYLPSNFTTLRDITVFELKW